MSNRGVRKRELEAIARSRSPKSESISAIYVRLTGTLPPIGSLEIQDLIPKILELEFPGESGLDAEGSR